MCVLSSHSGLLRVSRMPSFLQLTGLQHLLTRLYNISPRELRDKEKDEWKHCQNSELEIYTAKNGTIYVV